MMNITKCFGCCHAGGDGCCEPMFNDKRSLRIALVGNPNCGKTALFNVLTGDYERVGNYPGITVELKSSSATLNDIKHEVIDLPGVYSLSAISRDEEVTLNFLTQIRPDIIINVLDASNLERNLYLTAQLSELGIPTVLALNMIDVAERAGFSIDTRLMTELLGVPVIALSAKYGTGVEQLRTVLSQMAAADHKPTLRLYDPPHEIHDDLEALEAMLDGIKDQLPFPSARWCAVELVEQNQSILDAFAKLSSPTYEKIRAEVDLLLNRLRTHSNESGDVAVAEARYAFATGLFRQCVKHRPPNTKSITERIDRWVCHRFFGLGIMLVMMYLLFTIVIQVATELPWLPWGTTGVWVSPQGMIEGLFELLGGAAAGIEIPWLQSMIVDGIIAGVGGVLSFVPLLFFMFIFIAILEDSGYIARVAFILDRLLRAFGLQGKSVLSLIMAGGLGPGCAVPAVVATRTLHDEKDRIITMLVAPFMNCGAKIPVLALFVSVFFPYNVPLNLFGSELNLGFGLMMMLFWALSWVFALSAAWVLSKFVIRGKSTPFVLELPIYHMPRPRGVLMHACYNTWLYIRKAGTIILAVTVIIWAAMYFPGADEAEPPAQTTTEIAAVNADSVDSAVVSDIAEVQNNGNRLEQSYAGRFGKFLAPVSSLCGFDWRDNIALLGGAGAKEIVLSTLLTAYAMEAEGDDDEISEQLSERLKSDESRTPLRALALLLFVMLYSPCVATLAVIYKETRSWKWIIFASVYSTVLAFIVATLVYQIGLRFF